MFQNTPPHTSEEESEKDDLGETADHKADENSDVEVVENRDDEDKENDVEIIEESESEMSFEVSTIYMTKRMVH